MNPKAKARKRQRDRARAKEKKAAVRALSSKDVGSPQTTVKETNVGDQRSRSPLPVVSSTSSKTGASSAAFTNQKFLTPQDGEMFEQLMDNHYQGFVHLSADDVTPSNFHQNSKAALERLRDANYYQYDVVKAGGKHSSRTFVKRTLVGEPGITYKYLGLRLFAHAWSGPGVSPAMKAVAEMNRHMIDMTKRYKNHGKCNYNLTLINYMEPTSHTRVGFKDEAYYGMGKVSVSWHADSSLENNSSIGVYHCLPTQRHAKWDWRIALRRSPESGEDARDVLPVSVSTKDGEAYFLLGNFNETHQHCVLAGSEANRISSTHRVAVTEEDTYQYILKRVKKALKRFRSQMEEGQSSNLNAKIIKHCQRVLSELEMEWIAQYWLQGAQHDKMHTWWQRPMKTLEAFWLSLEELTFQLYQLCVKESESVNCAIIEALLAEMKSRQELRAQWDERRADKIYERRISPPFRPVARPVFDAQNKLSKNLIKEIATLTNVLSGKGGRSRVDGGNGKAIHSEVKRRASGANDTHGSSRQPSAAPSHVVDMKNTKKKRAMEFEGEKGGKKKKRKSKPVKLL